MSQQHLTTAQSAAHLGLTYNYFRHVLAAGRGPSPAYRAGEGRGGQCYFAVADLDQWQATRPARLVRYSALTVDAQTT